MFIAAFRTEQAGKITFFLTSNAKIGIPLVLIIRDVVWKVPKY